LKRFTDTNLNREPWFRKLKPKTKCAIRFLFDECNAAGIWVIDMETLSYFVGEEVTLDELLPAVNSDKADRIEVFNDDKLFIPGFVEFQYGRLSEDCKPHKKIIALLSKYNLLDRVYKGYTKGINTLQEEEEDKEEEKDGKGAGGKPSRRANIRIDKADSPEVKAAYQEVLATVGELADVKEQRKAVGAFIAECRPNFIEPYMDLWNLSVKKYGVAQVENASEGRLKKFKTRIREPAFDFIKILTEINQSDYLQGKKNDWKIDWDWIFENDTNYLKIIEGKYRNSGN